MESKRRDLERQVSLLQGRKESKFRRVQRLYDLIDKLDDPTSRSQFETLYEMLEETMAEYTEIIHSLNEVNLQLSDKYTVDYQPLEAIQDMCCFIRKAARNLGFLSQTPSQIPSQPPSQTQPPIPTSDESISLTQLPKIELPTFSGDLTKWPFFYETFSSLIHKNPKLDDVVKAYYLVGSLKGNATEVCAGMAPTAANYPLIWENLVRRYQNTRRLAEAYFQKLVEFRPLTTESPDSLLSLAERSRSSIKALKQLKLADVSDFMAASLTLSKLDPTTKKAFEMSDHSAIPTHEESLDFIERRAGALASVKVSSHNRRAALTQESPRVFSKPPQVFLAKDNDSPSTSAAKHSRPCPLCRSPHTIYQCDTFGKASKDLRWKLVEKHKLCFNCLSDVHQLSACNSESSCRICHRRHHSLLHRSATGDNSKIDRPASGDPPNPPPTAQDEVHSLVAIQLPPKIRRSVVVLPTTVVKVAAPRGEFLVRFLVDSGSQAHLISLNCARKLGLDIRSGTKSLGGIGGVSERVRGGVNFVIQSRLDPEVQLEVDALVLRRITTSLPPTQLNTSDSEKFAELPLADPAFDCPGKIDGVLGADIFARILNASPPIKIPQGPSAVATQLGYLILGSVDAASSPRSPPSEARTFCVFEEPNLEGLLQRFWELENVELPPESPALLDECEKKFRATTTRNSEGRYCVELPFAEFPPRLGDSFAIAKNRLFNLEKHLEKSPEFLEMYREGMKDYLSQGHVSPAPSSDVHDGFFIPHFAVIKSSSSTPVRIVFDASCKTSNGRSLNDVLLTGPKLQSDIQDVLLRFRVKPVALVADIRQMFRNIEVSPPHRKFQQFLWRFQPGDPLQIFQLNCVPFGLRCAPFLALRTVKQLAEDERSRFPTASRIAASDMYVDDVVTSLQENEVAEAIPQLLGLFRAGGFSLTKWYTNFPGAAQFIPKEDLIAGQVPLDKGEAHELGVKVLGLKWDAASDTFFFTYNAKECTGTKRQILSTLARIWDPLGFLAPLTFLCKNLVKRLWLAKCGWDDPPPDSIQRTWTSVISELPNLTNLSVPRYPGMTQDSSTLLVGFADSSELGYGAVVYVICCGLAERVDSTLLAAKSKVAPTKLYSIPRLELCAALLLTKLLQKVRVSFPHIELAQIYALSDSEDVLYWLSKSPASWKTFVANRVAQIQEVIPAERWHHVPGAENVADLVSRGATPLQLLNHPTWGKGPPWLTHPVRNWPVRRVSTLSRDPLEGKPLVAVVTDPERKDPLLELIARSSSWPKLCRVVVYILRFGKRLPSGNFISAAELETAERRLVRIVQMEHFAKEFALLAQKKPPSPALQPLHPVLHEGCIRVGGRLEHAPLTFERKYPLLLPKRDPLTDLIIDHVHRVHLHAGPTLVIALLRQKFWILGARSVIRSRIHSCNRCFRFNPKNTTPLMGSLPTPRVAGVKPFLTTGVDFAGPFRVTIGRYRGVRTQKAYICLFVCLSTKALHLELATGLSTEAFLNCFVRFISRRGPVSLMYSDCGTNFVGAKTKLEAHHELTRDAKFNSEVGNFLAARKIEWKFNPPAAPHFGGLWEVNVKSVKAHLFRTIGTQILSWEEFSTLLTQIEAVLNSRPLCILSSDPGEVEALTPAHFLCLTPLHELPLSEPNPEIPLKVRKNLLTHMISTFWKRWQLEYLTSLHPRKRWMKSVDSVTVGTVVIVRDDNLPPLRWPLGVVEEIHPGTDGVVRVATVRVRGVLFKRPVVRLYRLPNQ